MEAIFFLFFFFFLHLVSESPTQHTYAHTHTHTHTHTLSSPEDGSEVDSEHVSMNIWDGFVFCFFLTATIMLHTQGYTCTHTHTHALTVIGLSLCDLADEGSGLRGCSLETSCASLCTSRWPSGRLTVRVCVEIHTCETVSDLDMSAHAPRRPLF